MPSSESETGKIRKVPKTGKIEPATPAKEDKTRARVTTDLHVRQLVRFVVGDAEFGVDVSLVREIKRATEMTSKSAGTSDVCGAVSVDDHVIEVFDLGARLGYQPRTTTPVSRIIIFHIHDQMRGALVDEVIEVLRLEQVKKDRSASPDTPIETALIRETLVLDNRRIMVLDWPRILGL